MLRPLRDQILRISGFEVDSTLSASDGLSIFMTKPFDLVLIDVEGEDGIPEAEHLCSEVKTAKHEQLVAFVCNWRVSHPHGLSRRNPRTEFDPASFVEGVRDIVVRH